MPRYDEILERVKASPHWRVLLRPVPYVEGRLQLEELLSLVQRNTVRFRGWDFPHLNRKDRPLRSKDYVAAADAFMGHLEYWRLHVSGQFLYLAGVREWFDSGWRERLARTAPSRILTSRQDELAQAAGFLDVGNIVYTITEYVEFAARVHQSVPGVESVKIVIGLRNVEGFALTVDDWNRGELHGFYAWEEPDLENSWEYSLSDLVGSTTDRAMDIIKWFLVRFGWTDPNMEAIKRDIQELTQRAE